MCSSNISIIRFPEKDLPKIHLTPKKRVNATLGRKITRTTRNTIRRSDEKKFT